MPMTLTQARKRRKLSRRQLSDASKVDYATISRLERGIITNPLTDTVKKLEEALQLRRGTLQFGPVLAAAEEQAASAR